MSSKTASTILNPPEIRPPFARYAHGLAKKAQELLVTSGQLGVRADDSVPESALDQARQCFANLDAILKAGGMTRGDVMRINAYVTAREHMQGYMTARDEWLADIEEPPASTLVIVSGFTRPEFKVEIELTAAR